MTTLYNRHVSIEIGKEGEEGRRFEELFISFDITKGNTSDANKGTVAIHNLNQASRDLISQKGAVYILRAGYYGINEEPLIEVLSKGDIESIITEKNGTDLVTKLTLTEDGKKLRDKTIDKSFAAGVTSEMIVGELAKTLDIAKGTIKGVTNKIFNSGASVSGKVKDRLDEITKNDNLEWSIQNNELIILPKGESTNETAVSLTNESGLLFAKKVKVNDEEQIAFKCLLNPNVKVGRKIYISNNNIEGFFVTKDVKYSGDNKTGPFFCEGHVV